MGIHTDAVQQLYVAYFSRPADFGGLAYWEQVVGAASGDTSAVSAAFAASQEYKDTYAGKSAFQVINTIYQNLFGRDAEPAALLFWGNALNNHDVSIDSAVTTIAAAAQGSDAIAYANKVTAAGAFSAGLDTTAEILGYSGAAANGAAREWLAGITTDESLSAAIVPATLSAAIGVVADNGIGVNNGQTYYFTKGLDNLTGTASNDLFIGSMSENTELNTMNALDAVNGGGGVDTLRVLSDGSRIDLPALSGIEIVEAQSARGVQIDTSNVADLTKLNVTRANGDVWASAASATDIAVTLAPPLLDSDVRVDGGKNVAVTLNGVRGGNDIHIGAGNMSVRAAIGADAAPQGSVAVNVTGQAYTPDSHVEFGDIHIAGGATIAVTQKAAFNTNAAGADMNGGSIAQGNVNIHGSQLTTEVSVKQDAYVKGSQADYTIGGATETASVTFSALGKGQSLTVHGAFGTQLVFTAGADMTAAQVAAAFAGLDASALPVPGASQGAGLASLGVYTGFVAGWTSGTATGDTVVFTSLETDTNVTDLRVTAHGAGAGAAIARTDGKSPDSAASGGVAGVYAGEVAIHDAADSIKTVTLDGYDDTGSHLEGGASLATLNLANGGDFRTGAAATLALNLHNVWQDAAVAATPYDSAYPAVAAQIEIVAGAATLNLKNSGANTADITSNATTALNVSGAGSLSAVDSGFAALKSITVTDTAGLDLGSTMLANVESVNTTATTGAVSVAIHGDKASYAGGAGADSVTIAAASAGLTKSMSLGAGDDTLDLGQLSAAKLGAIANSVTLSGGDGADTLVLNAGAAATLSTSAAFGNRIDGFEKLSIGALSGDASVNLANLDNIHYIISNGGGGIGGVIPLAPTSVAGSADMTEKVTVEFDDLLAGETYYIDSINIQAREDVTGADIAAALVQVRTQGIDSYTGTALLIEDNNNGNYWTVGSATPGSNQLTLTSKTENADVDNFHFLKRALGQVFVDAPYTAIDGAAARTETNVFQFNGLSAGQSYTIAGRTVTANGAVSAKEVASAFIGGVSSGAIAVSGALVGWTVDNNKTTPGGFPDMNQEDARFTSTTPNANVTDISYTGDAASMAATLTLNNLAANSTVRLDAAGSVTANLADATGAADTINLIANAANATVIGTVSAHKIETVDITVNDTNFDTTLAISLNTLTLAADAAKTIHVSGAGSLHLMLDASTMAVTVIDGSSTTGGLSAGSSGAAGAAAVTIHGGSGNDTLIAQGNKADVLNGGAGNDILATGSGLATLTGGAGNDLFQVRVASETVNSYATITDFSAGDLLQFVTRTVQGQQGSGFDAYASVFVTGKIALGATAVFQDYANAAMKAIGADEMTWFQFGGDTYVVADAGVDSDTFVNGQDFIVKLAGMIDLGNASFNDTFGTIGLV